MFRNIKAFLDRWHLTPILWPVEEDGFVTELFTGGKILFDALRGRKADQAAKDERRLYNEMLDRNRAAYGDYADRYGAYQGEMGDLYRGLMGEIRGADPTVYTSGMDRTKERYVAHDPKMDREMLDLLRGRLALVADPGEEMRAAVAAARTGDSAQNALSNEMARKGISTGLGATAGTAGISSMANLATQGAIQGVRDRQEARAAQSRGELEAALMGRAGRDTTRRYSSQTTDAMRNLGMLGSALRGYAGTQAPLAPYMEQSPAMSMNTGRNPWLDALAGGADGVAQWFANRPDKPTTVQQLPPAQDWTRQVWG